VPGRSLEDGGGQVRGTTFIKSLVVPGTPIVTLLQYPFEPPRCRITAIVEESACQDVQRARMRHKRYIRLRVIQIVLPRR
jgi:hypothetical protein